MNLLIKNGRVIDPSQNIDDTLDVLVENGLVKKIGAGLSAPAGTETIDATGTYVVPGLIDMHVHLRDLAAFAVAEDGDVVSVDLRHLSQRPQRGGSGSPRYSRMTWLRQLTALTYASSASSRWRSAIRRASYWRARSISSCRSGGGSAT